MGDPDIIQKIADILREDLETRPVITSASDVAAPIHPGWVGPISYMLADQLVTAIGLREDTQRVWPDEGDAYSERFWRTEGESIFDERYV